MCGAAAWRLRRVSKPDPGHAMRKSVVVEGPFHAIQQDRRRSRPEHLLVAAPLAPATMATTKVGPYDMGV
jgi:hypothetical protein